MAEKAVKLLAELVAIPSVNPAFLPPGDRRAGEQGAGEFLEKTAREAGLDCERQRVLGDRWNLLARLTPTGKIRRRIILAPHLDTVGCLDMPADCFKPVVKNGRLHGRGACDTKGSAAAMFTALLEVARAGERPGETEVIFAGLADEENAQEGSRVLARSRLKADLAIVGEPTRLQVVTAHKGDMWLKVVTQGKAAHGARPELGRSAVHEMAKVIHLLETKYRSLLKKRRHALLGFPTINVGSVRGGTQPNIVPDRCEISIDRRTIPGERDTEVIREINRFISGAGLKARIVNEKHNLCVAMETDPNLPLVQQLMAEVSQRAPIGVDFFCDAAILSAGGIPSVVFGPGDIAQAHTADEWISLRSLEQATDILTRFLRALP